MNSVLSLRVVRENFNSHYPYLKPLKEEVFGTGFVVNISEGLVLTNAHLFGDAINPTVIGRLARTGKRDISLELVGLCYEKDVAICKILDMALVTSGLPKSEIPKMELKFGDSMKVQIGDSALGLNNLKILTGIITSFSTEESDVEQKDRPPAYMETNIDLDQGPLLNSRNEVVGIFAKNKCVIPSRTILCVYNEMIKNKVVNMPNLGLEWCKTSRELMKKHTGSSSTYGIYVRKIYPDTCFDLLEKGDIIRRIDYADIFWTSKGDSNMSDLKFNGTLVTIFLDRFGTSNKIGKLKNPDEVDDTKLEFETIFTERKMELSEIMDMIPLGTNIVLNICRNQNWYKLKTKYIPMECSKIPRVCKDYEILAGLCLVNLSEKFDYNFDGTSNHVRYSITNYTDKYTRQVIIAQVFPGTSADKTQSLKSGHRIKSIIGYTSKFELIEETNRCISTLEDVREIMKLNPEIIQITATDDSTFMISVSTIEKVNI